MRRFFQILKLTLKISLIEQMSYPPSFWFALVGKTIRVLLLVIFYQGLFTTVPTFAGWTEARAILLVGCFSLLEILMSVSFHRNFAYYLSQDIHEGTFDHVLTKPIPLLLAVGLKRIDLMDFLTLIPIAVLLINGLQINHVSLFSSAFLAGTLYLLLALILMFAVYLSLGALTFWTVLGAGPGRLAESVTRIGQIPADVYAGTTRIILFYILPIVLFGTAPAKAFLGEPSWPLFIYLTALVGLMLWASLWLWQAGVRRYTSAGG